jgi:hypothetical protein
VTGATTTTRPWRGKQKASTAVLALVNGAYGSKRDWRDEITTSGDMPDRQWPLSMQP